MSFLIINVWTAIFFLTLKSTIELYSWCSDWVKKEGIQMVKHVIGGVWMMCQGIGHTFQFTMVRYMA